MTPATSRTPLPDAIPVKQVAQILDVHPMTVRRWIKRKYIIACRVGPTLVRIPRSEVNRMRKLRVGSRWDGFNGSKYPTV